MNDYRNFQRKTRRRKGSNFNKLSKGKQAWKQKNNRIIVLLFLTNTNKLRNQNTLNDVINLSKNKRWACAGEKFNEKKKQRRISKRHLTKSKKIFVHGYGHCEDWSKKHQNVVSRVEYFGEINCTINNNQRVGLCLLSFYHVFVP